MTEDTYLEHIWVNFSERSLKLMDNEGYDQEIVWEHGWREGMNFAKMVAKIQEKVDKDMITYQFVSTDKENFHFVSE